VERVHLAVEEPKENNSLRQGPERTQKGDDHAHNQGNLVLGSTAGEVFLTPQDSPSACSGDASQGKDQARVAREGLIREKKKNERKRGSLPRESMQIT